ncbi:Retrovirus-related Pol polyprotein from transposon RE2 [Sesamum angolense]|uniref:Retrovirus-related Pol polyprotein from transposon RE2 n=1 Tax=Sesamum angolense TaxID=2727404 RepID=A0AAE1WB40_9LAMI|nr:Retrovirus-related Pol polyprotein from transposon RE2 [Sesamum angolense]
MATELVEKTPARDTTEDSLLEKDVLFLHPSDHPGMALSSTPMDGTNFLPWTRAVSHDYLMDLELDFERDRQIVHVHQDRMRSVELWDEIVWLEPPPKYLCGGCSCDISKVISERMEAHQVMQFLMGLHDSFDAERSQILMLDPLPNVQKVYAMILRIEKQRAVQVNVADTNTNTAYQVALTARKDVAQKKRDQKKKGTGGKALMANVTKTVDASPSEQNIGNTSNHSSIDFGYWIIDTGATNHICADITIFTSYAKPPHKHSVHLPDGTQKPVLYVGTVKLSDNFLLDNDQASRKTLALGTLYEKLYVLNHASFNAVHPSSPPVMSCSVSHCTDVVWHRCLGHASMRVIKQLPIPMTSLGDSANMPCTICPLAKQSRVPFPLIIDPQRAKFHKRALRCILLGYAPNKKAYKLYDLDNHHTVISRDVVFHEDVFPFDTQQSSTTTCPLPIPSTPDTHFDYPIPSTQSIVSSPALSIQTHVPLSTSGISSPQVPLHVPEAPIVRRSSRTIQKPCWLDDFICHLNYPHLLSSCNAAYISFVASLSILQEPRSFAEVSKSRQWRETMNSELAALEHNNTWIVTPLPEGKKAIGCKWVYKLKLNADGTVDRHKARLVSKGYNQIEGVDYVDCFSPVAKTVTVRVFLAIAAAHNWPIHQLDVNNAFLHGHLEEDIYMLPPEGSSVPSGMVCKLARSLYGLKQASRQWNLEFSSKLALFGFRQSSHDYCLFIKHTELGSLFLLVYVDNVLLTGPSMELLQEVKTYLHELFTIKDMGAARYFLGLEIARSTLGLYVTQTKYVLDIVHDAGLSNAKGVSTPFPQGLKLSSDCGALLPNPDSYRWLIGRLLYLDFTRPDISHSVQQLSQFLNHPCEAHWNAALHVVRYLKGCLLRVCSSLHKIPWTYELIVMPTGHLAPIPVDLFLDFVFSLGLLSFHGRRRNSPQCHALRLRQNTVAWLSQFAIYAALHITANLVFHERTKHIGIDCHVRDAYRDGFVTPSHVRSSDQLADVFTKVLPLLYFSSLTSKLGLVSLFPSPTCGGAVETMHETETAAMNETETEAQAFDAG